MTCGPRPRGAAMMSISKLLLIFAILISLQAVPPCIGTISTAAAPADSDRDSRGVGSAHDYMSNDSQLMADYDVPWLGIKVRNGAGKLAAFPRLLGGRLVE